MVLMIEHKGIVVVVATLVMLAPFLVAPTVFGAGSPQEESDGGLRASMDGDTYYQGDTITITGTVRDRDPDSFVAIYITDPHSKQVASEFPEVTADNTFTQTIQADFNEDGNYKTVIRYFPPGSPIREQQVEIDFAYHTGAAPAASPQLTPTQPQLEQEQQTTPIGESLPSQSSSAGTQLSLRSPAATGGGNNNQTLSLAVARQQYLLAWNHTAFSSQFNTYIEEGSAGGYGVYRQHVPANFFRPGEAIVLYVEPVGFGHKPVRNATTLNNGIGGPTGNNNITNGGTTNTTLYLTNLTADIIISDITGNELQAIRNVPAGTSISHRQNTELFLTLTLRQDQQSFPLGRYNITYFVHDQVSGQSFQIGKIITIGNNAAPSSVATAVNTNNNNNGAQASAQQDPQQPQRQSSSLVGGDSGGGGGGGEERSRCDPSYPDVCIPPPPPDLNCDDISARNFRVVGSDPHGFDGDNDGIGCEDGSSQDSSGSDNSDSGDTGGSDDSSGSGSGTDDSSGGSGDSGGSDSGSGDSSPS